MGRKIVDRLGKRFGRLHVVARDNNNKHNQVTWLCRCQCGNEKIVSGVSLTTGHSRSCGCLYRESMYRRRGATHPMWKGGRRKTSDGYIQLYPADGSGKPRLEHHLVVEQRLGRLLLPTEEVHHKNGIRSDNQDDNLELWTTNHPHGQRAKDLLEWAERFLETYGPLKSKLG